MCLKILEATENSSRNSVNCYDKKTSRRFYNHTRITETNTFCPLQSSSLEELCSSSSNILVLTAWELFQTATFSESAQSAFLKQRWLGCVNSRGLAQKEITQPYCMLFPDKALHTVGLQSSLSLNTLGRLSGTLARAPTLPETWARLLTTLGHTCRRGSWAEWCQVPFRPNILWWFYREIVKFNFNKRIIWVLLWGTSNKGTVSTLLPLATKRLTPIVQWC